MKKTGSKLYPMALAASAALSTLMVCASAVAEETAATAGMGHDRGLIAIGAGLAIGLAVIGGTLGQSKAAAAALDGIARNPSAQPKIQTAMILGLALIESLVVLAFLIAFPLQGKI